jgi:hypothetical protein
MSTATDRLALYLAAEAEILQGQEVRQDLGDGRGYRMLKLADLQTIRSVISELQRQIAAETSNAAGGSFGFALGRLDTTE